MNAGKARIFVGAAAAWAALVLVVVPSLIRLAYDGTSIVVLDAIMQGREEHSIGVYLATWWWIAGAATLSIALATALWFAYARSATRGFIGHLWFREPRFALMDAFLLAAALGLVLGFLEFVGWRVRYAITAEFAFWSNPHTIWMAPLASASSFILLFLPFALISRLARREISCTTFIFVALSLGSYGMVRSFRLGIAPAAVAILSLGLGAVAARGLGRRAKPLRQLIRRGTAPLFAAFAVLGLAMNGATALSEARAVARLSNTPAGARNVVLIILDTVRAQSLGIYGYGRRTSPNLRRFARNGLIFEQAFAPSPWTLPTHASLFTGRLPHEHGADWRQPLDDAYPTLAAYLTSRGYATAGFVANLAYTTRESGLDRGFIHYEDYPLSPATFFNTTWWTRTVGSVWADPWAEPRWLFRKSAPEMNADVLEWLDELEGRPFFAFINYFDAHEPYRHYPEYASRLGRLPGDSVPAREGGWVTRTPRMRKDLVSYESSIAFLDEQLGRLFDGLASRGLMDNTVVIVTSDHGEQFGEHGLRDHGNSLYTPVLRVPLLVATPDGDSGRVHNPVGLSNIPATIVGELDLEIGAPFPGRSLLDVSSDSGSGEGSPELVFAELGPLRSLVVDDFHYIRFEDHEELYQVSLDPWEAVDLTDSASYRDTLIRLRHNLDRLTRPDEQVDSGTRR